MYVSTDMFRDFAKALVPTPDFFDPTKNGDSRELGNYGDSPSFSMSPFDGAREGEEDEEGVGEKTGA